MSSNIFHVNAANYDAEVINAPGLVIIDFWAAWCGPCIALGKTLEVYAAANKDPNIKIVKINVDESPEIANKFGITAIPALVATRMGREADRNIGNIPLKKLADFIDRACKKSSLTNINKARPGPKGPKM